MVGVVPVLLMEKNFKLSIEYDGTHFHGWQKQKNDRTIQGEIENAIQIITGEKISLIGSGRTDAGVHAFAQIANFHCNTLIPPGSLLKGINSLIDNDIVITRCIEAENHFHARFNAKCKTYHYHILNRKTPAAIYRKYAWFIIKELDFSAMESALKHIIGTYDFKSFEGAGSPRAHTVRNVIKAELLKKDNGYIVFEIKANGFLRFMVRNIIGTLVDVGLDKINSDDFNRILLSKDRTNAGITAPPHGLFLMNVEY